MTDERGPALAVEELSPYHRFCVDFDHWDSEYRSDPYPVLEHVQAHCPVVHAERYDGYWVVTRHEDVLTVAQDPGRFSSLDCVGIPTPPTQKRFYPGMVDPPAHREYRRVLNPWFTAGRVAPLEPGISRIADELIDRFIGAGECDLARDFAEPLPGLVFFRLVLGIDKDEVLRQVLEWTTATLARRSAEEVSAAFANVEEFVSGTLRARAGQPARDDVVNAIMTAEVHGAVMPFDVQVGMLEEIIFGGLETTANAIANSLAFLVRHPEHRARIATDRAHRKRAIEEFLRLEPPAQFPRSRRVMEPVEVGGASIARDERILMSIAAANRDPDVFPDPQKFDPDRSSNRHLAFGAGHHRCLGSHLARLQFDVALGRLLERIGDYALRPGGAIGYQHASTRGVDQLPVIFPPGPQVGGILVGTA